MVNTFILNILPFGLIFRKYNLAGAEYQVNLRIIYIPLLLLLLIGCTPQSIQPTITATETDPSLSEAGSPAASVVPLESGQTRAIPIEVPSHEAEATAVAEDLPVGYPDSATPIVATETYPGPGQVQVPKPTINMPLADYFGPEAPEDETNGDVDALTGLREEKLWGYRIVNEYPHDRSAFTQGLVIEDDLTTLLEGTGLGSSLRSLKSSLRRVDLQTGEVEQFYALPDPYFGEGITVFDGLIVQLTYRDQVGFVYDRETFELLGSFTYPHQGWGLTNDGEYLIVSDGSDIIRFWDPATFQEVRRIQVQSNNGPVSKLNELEFVDGEIWANIWITELIVRISPEDGRVLGWINLAGILSAEDRDGTEDVMNGIAYDERSGRLFVTGKYWPLLFEIEVGEPSDLMG